MLRAPPLFRTILLLSNDQAQAAILHIVFGLPGSILRNGIRAKAIPSFKTSIHHTASQQFAIFKKQLGN